MATDAKVVVGNQYCDDKERELTVRKTSLFFPSDGFEAYDNQTGNLIFRVDNYVGRGSSVSDELVLMDPAGASIITLHRKLPSLHSRWEAFLGERVEGQKLLFSVRRSSIFGGNRGGLSIEYRVEGSFAARSCRVLYEGVEDGEVVAEIKRKVDACANVVFGRDVFCLCLRPQVDSAFAMGLVLVLDRLTGDNDLSDDDMDSAAVGDAEMLEGGVDGSGKGLLILSQ
ncbi:Protein LURP-one-related 5 [Platanthera zijinensis]|uniref:Protein LURP-one-related 5 n=1 Tax=Platanthera zijinensis TaxID=2320716 RepID=A0AAP0GBM7_9ASPA